MRIKPGNSKHSFFPSPTPEPKNDSGWQVSYLDIITLLLASLIIILSVSQPQLSISDYFQSTGETEYLLTPIEEIKTELEEQLQQDIDQGRISIIRELNDLIITFNNSRLYRPGEATLIPEARPLLDKVLNALQATYNFNFNIDVEGHTDNTPIVESSYPSNWELSTARAANVVKYLSDLNFDERRLKASGYAYSRPLVPNEDSNGNQLPENKEQNRRIVLRIYHEENQLRQPQETSNSISSISNNWENSNCTYSLQTGGYQTLYNAMEGARKANNKTDFDFRLTYNNKLFSVRMPNVSNLSEAINLQPWMSQKLVNNQIAVIHQCDQVQWLHYQIQLGSFQQQNNANRFISELKENYDIDALIGQNDSMKKVVTQSLEGLKTVDKLLKEIKQIQPLADSFIIYDSKSVQNSEFLYQLQLASFNTLRGATQFQKIVSKELRLTPEVQKVDSLFVVVEKPIKNWERLLEMRKEIETYTNSPSIIHLIETFDNEIAATL
ncbi:MAG: OmpA family protein [Balneolaceae bacterium]